ncbi:hypothetical protein RJ639_023285 [Escallonia herrerae]|uniref:Uncharacterized protein n=1 Tax=Escallonia herrerae TaxID=1293975 RepID=A0AA89AD87_9ASTE|nr:hypothetical protein RJ639_023285 [Escallonia herrerae]
MALTNSMTTMLSRSLYVEYKHQGIDVQCQLVFVYNNTILKLQVPLYVSTKMASVMAQIERSSLFIPSADKYAQAAVRQIGYGARCTPYWAHSFQWFFASLSPEVVLDAWRLSIGIRRRGNPK